MLSYFIFWSSWAITVKYMDQRLREDLKLNSTETLYADEIIEPKNVPIHQYTVLLSNLLSEAEKTAFTFSFLNFLSVGVRCNHSKYIKKYISIQNCDR